MVCGEVVVASDSQSILPPPTSSEAKMVDALAIRFMLIALFLHCPLKRSLFLLLLVNHEALLI